VSATNSDDPKPKVINLKKERERRSSKSERLKKAIEKEPSDKKYTGHDLGNAALFAEQHRERASTFMVSAGICGTASAGPLIPTR